MRHHWLALGEMSETPWPGLGSLLVQGLTERDWMMIQNLVLIYGLIYIFVNLIVDISYAFLDPRIRYD